MERGWWHLSFQGIEDPSDTTLEHIADLIKEGFTQGEMLEEEKEEEDETD